MTLSVINAIIENYCFGPGDAITIFRLIQVVQILAPEASEETQREIIKMTRNWKRAEIGFSPITE